MNFQLGKMKKKFIQVLIASVFVMSSFVFADEIIELEFGNEAYEEYMSYVLEEGYTYEVSDEEILRIEEGVLYPNTFGDAYLIVKDENNTIVKEVEVIVYFVASEETPFSPVTINKPFLSGYPDGTFKPKNFMTRAELASIINDLLPLNEITHVDYPDLLTDHWAYDDMHRAISHGFIDTISDEAFPESFVTRLEMAEFVESYTNYHHLDIHTGPMSIEDTDSSAVKLCLTTGLMQLENNKFEPEGFIRREQVVSIINDLICRNLNSTQEKTFIDVPIDNKFYMDIKASTK